ncbi:hypothetical protein FSP39_017465 [Pinctada imbricata]|uniref:Centromere protein N n=1 Tax=Pinctada imbricata TaxID=66713 RepID=A0AA89BKW3_PINIB|nr:hypothetical protein FSP39_017465 [Pinctada imbricata]
MGPLKWGRTGKFSIQKHESGLLQDISREVGGFQSNAQRKKWSIYHLEDKKGNAKTNFSLSNIKNFKKKLRYHLSLYFNGDLKLASKVFDGAIWTRLYLPLPKKSSRFVTSDVIYLVHYPHTEYIALSNFKESARKYLFQSLLSTFGYMSVKNLVLTGNHLHSLFQLALNKKAQGSFSRNQLSQIQNLPPSLLRPRKRKVCEVEDDPNIHCYDKGTKKQKLDILESQFGPHEQPILEKVEFKLETRLRGADKPQAMVQYDKESFHCSVKFEGHGVLEGIRNLAECGLADLPLPNHLSSMHSLAKNHFVLKDSTSRNKSMNKTKD